MIWVAWRQHRTTILSMLGAIAVAAVVMVSMRFMLDAALRNADATGCLDGAPSAACDSAISQMPDAFGRYGVFWPMALQALTLVGGAIVGATVFGSELSAGSHMFSLTQSVSRKRWWVTKFTVVVMPLLLATLTLGAISHWAFLPFLGFGDRAFRAFDSFGLMPAAFFLFAVSVGAFFGLIWKSVMGSLVVAALAVMIIAFSIGVAARPHYMEPITEVVGTADREPPNGLLVDQYHIDKGSDPHTPDCDLECADEKYDFVIVHHPPERLWPFQGIETGIYVLLSAGFLSANAVAVRKRLP